LKMTLPSLAYRPAGGDAHGLASGDAHVREFALGSLRAREKLLTHTAPLAKNRRSRERVRSGFVAGSGKTPHSHSPACQEPLAAKQPRQTTVISHGCTSRGTGGNLQMKLLSFNIFSKVQGGFA